MLREFRPRSRYQLGSWFNQRGPYRPARGFAVEVRQGVIVRDQMIGEVPHHLAHALALGFSFRHEIVIGRVEEIVPVQFIRAGVALPIPLAIGALGPARFVGFPQAITFLFFAVGFNPPDVRVRPIHGADGARHETFGRAVRSALGDLLKETQGLEGLLRAFPGGGVFRRAVGETFARTVHRRPETVVVAVRVNDLQPVSRRAEADFRKIAERRALDVTLHLVLVIRGLLRQRHGPTLDAAQSLVRGEPDAAIRAHDE